MTFDGFSTRFYTIVKQGAGFVDIYFPIYSHLSLKLPGHSLFEACYAGKSGG